MEAYLNDKFDAFENHQNAEELERNIYGNCKKKEASKKKKKAHTKKTENNKGNKFILKKIKKSNENSKKKSRLLNIRKNISNNKIHSLRIKNKKRARTPIKAKHSSIISRKKDIEKIEQKKEKKFKNDTESNFNELTELDSFQEKYDNSNLLKKVKNEDIFDELERDEKIEKEGIHNLQEILSNEQKLEEQEQEIPDVLLNSLQLFTEAITIELNEIK